MEPSTYSSFTSFQGTIPPPTLPENPGEGQEESASQEKQTEQNPGSMDWTVYSPNVTRGNLDGPEDPKDPRTSVGWIASSHKTDETVPWMSTTAQQPFMASGGYVLKEDEATPRGNDPKTPRSSYPHPDLSLPHPSLSLDFRMSVQLNPRVTIGRVPFGHRNWISFTGGTWSGCWGSGIVLPGGQDSQIIIPDGSAYLDTNYLLQTHDDPPAHIVVKTHGWRTGPPEILAQLADPVLADKVDPRNYKFRIFVSMETGDERYRDKVNCGMWLGSGMRKGLEVIYDAYRVS